MAQKMRAVRLFAPKDIRCVEVDVPHIEKDTQVLIKVKSCGVCGGAFSGYCACLFLTSSASGLSCCPSFSFSATSGVGGASSS